MNKCDLAHGFVVGSWQQPAETGGAAPIPYPARLDSLWNGFEDPYFDRETVERFIRDQAAYVEAHSPEDQIGLHTFSLVGDTLLIEEKTPPPGTAAEEAPGRVEAVDIDGELHWNVGCGFTWEQVTQAGEPVNLDPTPQQRDSKRHTDSVFDHIRETLKMTSGLRRRLDDGSDVFPVSAHLGGHEDFENAPIPVHVHVGTVTIAPDGTTVLKLEYDGQLDTATPSKAS